MKTHLITSLLGGLVTLIFSPAQAGHVLSPAHHGGGAPVVTSSAFVPPNFTGCNFTVPTTFPHVWYIDPVSGQTENAYTAAGISLNPAVTPHQGDIAHPWKDLNAVATTRANARALGYADPLLAAGIGPIFAGDEVLLQSGTAAQYGAIGMGIYGFVYNQNGAFVTFKPAPGATVTLASLALGNLSSFAISGINIQSTDKFPLLQISAGNPQNLVLDNLNISSTDAATAQTWTQAQWRSLSSNGIVFKVGSCVSLKNSHIFNVATAAGFNGGTQIMFQNNEIDHLVGDGLDFHGNDLLISDNYVHDFVNDGSGEHIDGMQGFNSAQIPSSNRLLFDSNTIVFQADPNLPFASGAYINGAIDAGGCCWTNFYANNNKIYWPNFIHGISIDNCTNCMFENNTLAGGFIVTNGSDQNLLIKNNLSAGMDCKGGDQAGVQMENNVMYHGGSGYIILCFGGALKSMAGGASPGTYLGNNIVDTGGVLSEITALDLTTFTYNFALLSNAPARGAGTSVDYTPQTDSLGNPLNSPPDVGAIQVVTAGSMPPPTTAQGAAAPVTSAHGKTANATGKAPSHGPNREGKAGAVVAQVDGGGVAPRRRQTREHARSGRRARRPVEATRPHPEGKRRGFSDQPSGEEAARPRACRRSRRRRFPEGPSFLPLSLRGWP
jgi:hypothetical protein